MNLSHADDHGHTFGSATLVGMNSNTPGILEVGGDADYFRFAAQAGAAYTLRTALLSHPDTTLTRYDTNGTSVLAFNDDFGGTLASRIDWVAPASGEYFAAVRGFNNSVGSYQLLVDGPATPTGDFNGDGLFDIHDIDALIAAIAAGSNNPTFDINGDGLVNLQDRDAWLAIAGAINLGPGRVYRLGDANLDGVVDGQDFIAWNAHKFTSTPRWSAGDFNGDGLVDGQDFIILNGNKFTASDERPAFVEWPQLVEFDKPLPSASRWNLVEALFAESARQTFPSDPNLIPATRDRLHPTAAFHATTLVPRGIRVEAMENERETDTLFANLQAGSL